MDKLTPQQAIKQGYTHYTVYQTEHFGRIEDLSNHVPTGKIMLLDKTKTAFSIDADTIHGLLQDHINGQEEFSNEDEELDYELSVADFEKIAELVNIGFVQRFMFTTDIELEVSNG